MAIQPIDLQVLYSQLENVSKNVAFQQQGIVKHEAITAEKEAEKLQEKKQTVEETRFQENQVIIQKDGKNSQNSSEKEKKESKNQVETIEDVQPKFQVIRDPLLGQHIDITV
ncbi:MAG: hypothetical protein GX220_03780 [Treponema sp.]|jgi:hypothetical protein|nr:hypothetical protein [Treponema sp.]